MAALTITAASVAAGSNAEKTTGIAGATITAGQVVYMDESDSNKFKLADADASATTATVFGIALHAASSGQPLTVQTGGNITIGATVAVGTIYVAGATAGAVNPSSDLASGWRTSVIGIATSTTVIAMKIINGGAAVP